MRCGRSRSGELLLRDGAIWPGDLKSLACASVGTSGAAFDSFNVAAERQTGRYGDKPFVTWYDDHRDERVELSYKTFDNWVAKTANLLVDELGAEPGDRVGAALVRPLAGPGRAGCLLAGRPGRYRAGPGGPRQPDLVAAFVREEQLAAATAPWTGPPVVALTADLFGRAQPRPRPGAEFLGIVPSMGDVFETGPDPTGDALTAGGETATMTGCSGGRPPWPTGPAWATPTGCCRAGGC